MAKRKAAATTITSGTPEKTETKPQKASKVNVSKHLEPTTSPTETRKTKKAKVGNSSTLKNNEVPSLVPKTEVSSKEESTEAQASMSVHIIAGTYERILYGFKATLSRKASGQIVTPTLEPVFMYPAHTHSIKALACSSNGSTLVSGSFDEVIR